MAYVVLRRSRNLRSFYLVESYRDAAGRVRKRTLCYLGREADGTDSLEKAAAHWAAMMTALEGSLRTVNARRRQLLLRKRSSIRERLATIESHLRQAEKHAAEKRERERFAQEAEYWAAFARLRSHPSEANAQAARRAFLTLAKRHHPDQGGTHEGFLKLKDAYERAKLAWR